MTLRNMERGSLYRVLDWYNAGESYRYATGTDGHINMEALEDKFEAIEVNDLEFFLGIYRCPDNELVGLITGRLTGSAVWIKLMAVALEHRGLGLGSRSVILLLEHMREIYYATDCYLSVFEKNESGKRFWFKNGFMKISRLEKPKLIDGLEYDIIIMHKCI
jgi:ribosomal protein S18 acetylase RimI-like enzyme